jgi:hypothetical protein
MGMFRALRDLKKQSDGVSAGWNPAAQVAQAQAQMSAATEMLAQQTAAANAATSGVPGKATIVAVRPGNGMVNHQPIIEVDLTVFPDGGLPYAATVKQVIPHTQLAYARPGASVFVKIAADAPAAVWVDWERPAE